MSEDSLDRAERELIAQLQQLRLDHERQIAPIIKELTRIRSLRPITHTIDGKTYADIQSAKQEALRDE